MDSAEADGVVLFDVVSSPAFFISSTSIGAGGGGGNSEGGSDGGDGRREEEALLALAQIGRSLDSLQKDFVAAVQSGRVSVEIVTRFAEMDKSKWNVYRWLLQFGEFRERLLADDLFLAKVAMECGVGVFTKADADDGLRSKNDYDEAVAMLFSNGMRESDQKHVKAVELAVCDWIHVDVMDGRFVPNITIGPLVVDALGLVTDLPLDVHLMIVEPDLRVPDFIKAGAGIISVHCEQSSTIHLHGAVNQIKSLGAKAGVVLNPGTPLSARV
ncbi:hypothetical protein V2J09_003397 [Rumex salicifolius]